MINAEGVKRYCESLFRARPVYCWGADGQILTKEFLSKLIAKFGANHYDKIVLSADEGKIACDCSGMLTPISGMDATASMYFSKCETRGKAANMPLDKVCLVFRRENGRIVHVGIYDGAGTTYEMWNSCDKKAFPSEWWHEYGIPAWIEQTKEEDTITITSRVYGYMSADDALRGDVKKAKVQLEAGTYYVFKRYNGATNLTKKKGAAGAWVVV